MHKCQKFKMKRIELFSAEIRKAYCQDFEICMSIKMSPLIVNGLCRVSMIVTLGATVKCRLLSSCMTHECMVDLSRRRTRSPQRSKRGKTPLVDLHAQHRFEPLLGLAKKNVFLRTRSWPTSLRNIRSRSRSIKHAQRHAKAKPHAKLR